MNTFSKKILKLATNKTFLFLFPYLLVIVLILIGGIFFIHYKSIGVNIISKQFNTFGILDWINLIITIIGVIYISTIAFVPIFIIGILSLSKFFQYIRISEKFMIRNLGSICFITVIAVVTIKTSGYVNISNELLFTSIGATVVFWYGYKKYERDKEIELIKYYSERYNEINNKIKDIDGKDTDIITNLFSELINLWYSEFHLWRQGYISDGLWNEWEYWIKSDMFYYIYEGSAGFSKKLGGNYKLSEVKLFDIYFMKALSSSIGFFKFSKEEKYQSMSWKQFLLMLKPTIDDCHKLIEKNTDGEIKKLPSYLLTNDLFVALNSDLKD